MDCLNKSCAMCKKSIDNSSNYITVSPNGYSAPSTSYNNSNVYFHRFCYFNYRTMNDRVRTSLQHSPTILQ